MSNYVVKATCTKQHAIQLAISSPCENQGWSNNSQFCPLSK